MSRRGPAQGFQRRVRLDPPVASGYKPPMATAEKRKTWPRRVVGLAWKSAAAVAAAGVLMTLALRWVSPPTSAFMIGQHLEGNAIDYRWVPLSRISPHAALAVIASEDQNFFRHRGIDLEAIEDAIQDNRRRALPRGASTISQQTVKNLFLWPGRSYLRKGIEAGFTLLVEAFWPKRRILETYLNIVEMGRGVFGVEAAARRFFGKPAANLTRREAATLAAVLPGPEKMFADRPSDYVQRRARWIMKQMDQLGGVGFLKAEGL